MTATELDFLEQLPLPNTIHPLTRLNLAKVIRPLFTPCSCFSSTNPSAMEDLRYRLRISSCADLGSMKERRHHCWEETE